MVGYQRCEKWNIIIYSTVDFLPDEVNDSLLAEEDISPSAGLFFTYKVK